MKIFLNLFCRPGLIICALTLVLFVGNACSTGPVPPAQPTASEVRVLSGLGENYEVILKYLPFTTGSEVSLTAYILDKATNEPIQGAVLSGSMSSGSESLPCIFTEASPSIAGAYQGKIRVVGDEIYSWLFEISHGDQNDLIALDGFNSGSGSPGTSKPALVVPKENGRGLNFTVAEIIAVIAAFMVLQVAVFFFLRNRFSLTAAAKDPR